MAGYNGYSKSNNAVAAEANGRHPMTTAKKLVSNVTTVSRADAERVLKAIHNREWHHTSKMYNPTDYYDTGAAVWIIRLANELNVNPTDKDFLRTVKAYGIDRYEDEREAFGEEAKAEFISDLQNKTYK